MNYAKTALLLAAMTALFLGVGYMIGGAGGAGVAFLIALAMNGYAFWNSDTMALKAHNAEPVTRSAAPELFEMVERLSVAAGLPMPRVYIIHTDQPNAFATGRNPENAAVAVTTGIMRLLSHDELAGVVAHELAHIRNRDTLIMTVSATISGAIGFLAQFAFFFRDNRGPGGAIGALLVMIIAPLAATVVQMTISRTREYAADRAGAEICDDPLALASALRKISGGAARIELESAERRPNTAHLFIVNPLNGRGADKLFSTHPAVENRIAALEEMAGRALVSRRQTVAAEPSRVPRRPGSRSGGGRSGPWS